MQVVKKRTAERGAGAPSKFFVAFLTAFVLLHAAAANPLAGPSGGAAEILEAGRTIAAGGAPYVDVASDAGPLLLAVNALAWKLGGWRGTLPFEAAAIAVTIWCMFRTARLRASFAASLLLVSVITIFLSRDGFSVPFFHSRYALGGGNVAEEYALPWIALAMYLFLRRFQCGVLTARGCVLLGAGFAACLLLHPALTGLWALGVPVLLIVLCLERRSFRAERVAGMSCEFRVMQSLQSLPSLDVPRALWACRWMLAGFALVLVPVVLWLAAEGSLGAAWSSYASEPFRDILQRLAAGEWRQMHRGQARALVQMFFAGTAQVTVLCAFAMWRRPAPLDMRAQFAIAALDMAMFIACLPDGAGQAFRPFSRAWEDACAVRSLILAPLLVYPAAYFAEYVERCIGWSQHHPHACAAWMRRLAVFAVAFLVGTSVRTAADWPQHRPAPSVRAAVSYLQTHTEPGDTIAVWGRRDELYVLSGRSAAMREPHTSKDFFRDRARTDAYFDALAAAPPRMIVIEGRATAPFDDEVRLRRFLHAQGYQRVPLGMGALEIYEAGGTQEDARTTDEGDAVDVWKKFRMFWYGRLS